MEDILLDERINARFGTAQQLLQQQPNLLGAFTSTATIPTMDHASSIGVMVPTQQKQVLLTSPLHNTVRLPSATNGTASSSAAVLISPTGPVAMTTTTPTSRMVPNTLLPPIGTPVIGAIACPRDGKTPCIAAPQTKEVITITCTAPSRPPSFWTPWTCALVIVLGILVVYIVSKIMQSRYNIKKDINVQMKNNASNKASQAKEDDNKERQSITRASSITQRSTHSP